MRKKEKFELISFIVLIIEILIIIIMFNSLNEIEIESNYENIYTFSDDSWFLLDRENDKYVFQPIELGDWDYEVENETQLKKIIATYFINKYNMNENEAIEKIEKIFENINAFKNEKV